MYYIIYFIILIGALKEAISHKRNKQLFNFSYAILFLMAVLRYGQGQDVGSSIVDDENLEFCKNILNKYKDKIILPLDIVTSNNEIKDINNLDKEDIGYDIGPKTIELFTSILKTAKRVVINGPMGVFEEKDFSHGTNAIYQCLSDNNIKTLIGGGDSAASVNLLGYADSFYHISTGGGATLDYLSGKTLPGIDIIGEE